MSSSKTKIKSFLNNAFYFTNTKKLINSIPNIPFLPFYHVVYKDEELPHIKNLYSPRNRKTFVNDLEFILKYFEPVSLSEFIVLQNEKRFYKNSKPIFHLSFDDGLRQVYEIALPILEKKGIPATIFLNSDFIDNKNLFFRYKISLIIDQLNKGLIQAEYLIKYGTNKDNLLKINEENHPVFKGFEDVFVQFLNSYQPYMNTNQIKDSISRGFTFGAHSINHPYYNMIPIPEQIEQTEKSLDFIRENFNLDYNAFAFPFTDNGVTKKYFDLISKKNKLDISFGCAGLKKDSCEFNWQRIPFEKTNDTAEEIIRGEFMYSKLLKLFSRQTIKR